MYFPRLGVVPDASPGEFAHQQNKSGNTSNCGRDPPRHFMVRANTSAATLALTNGLQYNVRKFNRRTRQHDMVCVRPGAGCTRLLQWLGPSLGHDRVPTDIHATGHPTPAQIKGQFPGSAVWEAELYHHEDVADVSGRWDARVSSGHLRPDE